MKYRDYLNLGFERTDLYDSVEFAETGYYGFVLERRVSKKLSISVCSGELDKPKMYIKKQNEGQYHIINITGEMVRDLLFKKRNIDYVQTAC